MSIVGRLAPSPTGLLHLGHARSFLLAWWHARSRGGRVLLRIDDLDGARSRREFADAALRDLEWLGLDWDGSPWIQSSGRADFAIALERLIARGAAYPCICSRNEIRAAQSAPQEGVSEARYPGTCRGRFSSAEQAEQESGARAGLRFLVPPGTVAFEDCCAGPQSFDVGQEVGDFLLARRDGEFAYQIAVVVDDARQGVTEVVRGEDLLSSTARQLLLQRALDLPHPAWYHVPLVTDVSGARLAKRTDALALSALRSESVDPRAIVAWAARTSGQAAPDRPTPSDLLRTFDLALLPRERAAFTPADHATLRLQSA